MHPIADKKYNNKFLNILWIGLLTGTLDAIAAIIWGHKVKPAIIFRYIASGAFGKEAFASSSDMVFLGIFFHYYIAYSFTTVFYLAYPFTISRVKNKYLIAVIYAMITWLVTNLLVVPLSRIGWHPMQAGGILIGFGILIFTIGLPIALFTDKLYFGAKK